MAHANSQAANLDDTIAQINAHVAAAQVDVETEIEIPFDNPGQILRNMGLLMTDAEGHGYIRDEDRENVPRFLNRVLALQVAPQNKIFDFYSQLYEETVAYARANGTFDEGVTDIHALSIRAAAPPRLVNVDRTTGARTIHFKLEVDLPTSTVTFADAQEMLQKREGTGFYRYRTTKKTRAERHYILAIPAGRHTDPNSGTSYRTFSVTKPSGARMYYMNESELLARYQMVAPEQAREWWQKTEAALPTVITRELHILSGAILVLWERMKADREASLNVTRVTTDDGHRIVGIEISRSRINKVLRQLGLHRSYKTAQEIFHGVLEDGETIEIAGQMTLKQTEAHKETRIELQGASVHLYNELRTMGFINERPKYRQRFYVPTKPEKGIPLLEKLLERFPPLAASDEPEEEETAPESFNPEDLALKERDIFDLDLLVEFNADLASTPLAPSADTTTAPSHAPTATTELRLVGGHMAIATRETQTETDASTTPPEEPERAESAELKRPDAPESEATSANTETKLALETTTAPTVTKTIVPSDKPKRGLKRPTPQNQMSLFLPPEADPSPSDAAAG